MPQLFSKKQAEFILHSQATINLAHGSVRSGKTHCTLFRFGEEVIKCPDSDIVMIGKSSSSIYENAVKPFALNKESLYGDYCTWSPGKRTLLFADKEIRTIGAHDESAIGAIQGNTISIAYVDEMTLLPQGFLYMLYTRLSRPHSILFGTMNPESPFHPLKQMIDSADNKKVYALQFNIDDNPILTEKYKDFLKSTYTGLYYKRFVLGEWVQAEGAVFAAWDRNIHVIKKLPAADYFIVGIDVGSSNPFAALLIGVHLKHTPRIIIHKEYFWDPIKNGRQKTNAEFANDLDRFIFGYPVRCAYIDPAAESFEIELRKRKRVVKHAKNDVSNGLSSLASYFSNGDIAVHESCQNLIREIEGYTWDPKKSAQGEDEPIKKNDHCCDAMRYAVFSHFGGRPFIDPPDEPPFDHMSYPGFGGGPGGPGSGPGWQVFGGASPSPRHPFGVR